MTADAAQDAAADPDWEVLARVGRGDTDAFAGLVERHQDRLLAVCARLLGDREEARDACQEVFLRAFRKAGEYRPAGQVFTWLYRIAVNLCFNRLRRRRIVRFLPFATSRPGEEESVELDPPDPGPDAARRLLQRERWRATRRALDRLPVGQRLVVVLAKFEGLSYREIAAALSISEAAVESRLVRAMRTLERAAPQEAGDSGVSRAGD